MTGQIDDLRKVIAGFMGRGDPNPGSTGQILGYARQFKTGEWVSIDGGALRIRAYMVGTAHLEVHPEMAWRLNAVLASLYPAAIPPELRRKPVKTKKIKDFVLFEKPLPRVVINVLESARQARIPNSNPNRGYRDNYFIPVHNAIELCDMSKAVQGVVEQVIYAIGGVKVESNRSHYYQFDYNPEPVIAEIAASGCVPDHKAHQFYPTPERIAKLAVEMADIREGHYCLEPSAGIGGLADFMPVERTICVEVSKLHCQILKAKGFIVRNEDFLDHAKHLSGAGATHFSRVVMNPPFSEGRWQLHTEAAAKLVHIGGVLVAILPASAKNKFDLGADWSIEWSQVFDNEFDGTSVSVVIMKAVRGG